MISSLASRPKSIAVGVGKVRGSAVKRLRPVGSTSRRPRAGEPAGPGATRRPSSAASNAALSASALFQPLRIVRRGRRASVNMQAVFDGKIFQVAQPGIDAAQGVVGCRRGIGAGFACQSGSLRFFDNQLGEAFAPPPVEAVGLRIFVDQALKLARVAGKSGVH